VGAPLAAYTDAAGREAVLATDAPLGFERDEGSPRLFVREFDSKVVQAAVCAESFLEFLYRFWIGNEIYSALAGPDATLRPLTAEQSRYLAQYRR